MLVNASGDIMDFNPRTPCGVRPTTRRARDSTDNFNPRTPCGVRRLPRQDRPGSMAISIHAPLAGCDAHIVPQGILRVISIHAPLAGCDSPRRAPRPAGGNFNPRTPCGVRRRQHLHGGGQLVFQSTHPLRGATPKEGLNELVILISIHAPLAGCDETVYVDLSTMHNFNPRTPCGVRRVRINRDDVDAIFQSTHPLRGATTYSERDALMQSISIHAPLAGCDISDTRRECKARNFNPRTPCGVRHLRVDNKVHDQHFNPRTPCGVRRLQSGGGRPAPQISIHAPLAGCDLVVPPAFLALCISIHAPLAGCDNWQTIPGFAGFRFQSTHPLRGATKHHFKHSPPP